MAPQTGIFTADLFEKCWAGVRRKVQRGVEQILNPWPKFRIHTKLPFLIGRFYNTDHDPRDSYLLESSARSQALAIRQSRLAVSNETPRTSAVSSMLNLPK